MATLKCKPTGSQPRQAERLGKPEETDSPSDDLLFIGLTFRPQSRKGASDAEREKAALKNIVSMNEFLKPIFFDFDKDEIRPDQKEKLAEDLKIINKYQAAAGKKLYIFIGGHADRRGGKDYNEALSLRRANSVKNWLINKGVDPRLITVVAYGEEYPYMAKSTDPSWESDRWVDILVSDEPPTAATGLR